MTIVSKDGGGPNTRVDASKIDTFDAALFAEAEGGFSISALHFPGVFSEGESRNEAIENIRDAFELMRECCADAGEQMEYSSSVEFALPPIEVIEVRLHG
jgi:predicted RNase H-like HicB family nuclease